MAGIFTKRIWQSYPVAEPGILFGRGQSLTSSDFKF